MRKLAIVAVLGTLMSGCATVDTEDSVDRVSAISPKQEAMKILHNRGNTYDSFCTTTENDVLCELIPINMKQKGRQFINFAFNPESTATDIKVTRYVEFKLTNNTIKRVPLQVTEKQLNGFSAYIEKHRNKHANKEITND